MIRKLKELNKRLLTSKYDYPNDIGETFGEVSAQAASAWSDFANKNLKVCLSLTVRSTRGKADILEL
jgi:hypothetical protein